MLVKNLWWFHGTMHALYGTESCIHWQYLSIVGHLWLTHYEGLTKPIALLRSFTFFCIMRGDHPATFSAEKLQLCLKMNKIMIPASKISAIH